ncbi:MAG: AAA domain-containing protein [Dehalococcoidia bacterium]
METAQLGIARERIAKLFQFLEAFNQLRNPVVRHLERASFALWLDDLPEHPAVTVGWHDDEAEFVLTVGRPRLAECPTPPRSLDVWLQPGWAEPDGLVSVVDSRPRSPTALPDDPDHGASAAVEPPPERFDEAPDRVSAFDRWRAQREEWAEQERPARAAMRVFQRLYALHGDLQRENGQVELVAGDAVLDWYVSANRHFHPLVLQPVQIELEPEIPRLVVTVADRGPELYTALLRATEHVEGRVLTQLLTEFEAGEYTPFSGDEMDGFLAGLATRLHAQGEFTGPGAPPVRRDSPTIGRRPLLFTRSRNQGYAVAIEAILEDIEEREDFPNSLLSIVGIEPPTLPPPSADELLQLRPANEDPDILFTKPANEAQAEIARRLERYRAVMVQGPPGTGKTHTIANLIGHLLAEGKRVLVTSHTVKALERVREVIVEDLQPLAVSVVANDLEGRAQLEESVTEITRRLNDNPDLLRRQAAQLTEQRQRLLMELERARRDVFEAIDSETLPIVIDGAEIRPASAAEEVRRGNGVHDWIPGPTEDTPLALTTQEVLDLYRTNVVLAKDDEMHLARPLPEPFEFWTPDDFARQVALEATLVAADRAFAANAWRAHLTLEVLAGIEECLVAADAMSSTLEDAAEWEWRILEAGRRGGGFREMWEHLLREIEQLGRLADEAAPLLGRHGPRLPDDVPLDRLRTTLRAMQQHAKGGGSFGRLTLMLRAEWSRTLSACSVATGRTDDPEALDALVVLADLTAARDALVGLWDRVVAAIGGPPPASLGREPELVAAQHATRIRRLLDWHDDAWEPFVRSLEQLGIDRDRLFDDGYRVVGENAELRALQRYAADKIPRALGAKRDAIQLAALSESFAEAGRRLAHYDGATSLGSPVRSLREAVSGRDTSAYRDAYHRLVALHGQAESARLRATLLGRLEACAPAWANAIHVREVPHHTSEPPGDVVAAWRWRRLVRELDRRAALSPDEIQARIGQLTDELQRCTGSLVSARAWGSQIEGTTFEQQTALKGWQGVMRKVGRGTGKRVPRLLAEARQLMGQSREAVPVWIMPVSRVVETFDFRATEFDVVIIDEASQSDVLALTALYLGRQVVIVGDNEQVSPDPVGQRLDDLQRLIDQYLVNIPNREIYDGRTSIYDLGGIAFPGSVMLKEHFRCVPEIIQFSNDLSYEGKILPLRDTSDVQLKPHVIAHRVEGERAGGTSSRAVNHAEAEFIASAIIAACEMPEYRDATFGVISMLGEEQARLIDGALRERLDPAEFEGRRILAGTPPQFQGDERDVVFLSLVDSPGEGPLTMRQDEALKRRYNVAASRARDQLWVVHSLSPERDLKPGDLRERLIRYAQSPTAMMARIGAATANAQSPFEEAVGAALGRRGYRVESQHPVGAYRIDLVVHGSDQRRVAIECDGERWHTRENLAQDLARQAQLERLGWRFIRIRGSEYYRDPEGALDGVVSRLSAMGIEPSAVDDDPSASAHPDLLERLVTRSESIRHDVGDPSSSGVRVSSSASGFSQPDAAGG